MKSNGSGDSDDKNTESKKTSRAPLRSRKNENLENSNKENIQKPQEKKSRIDARSMSHPDSQRKNIKRTSDPDLKSEEFIKDEHIDDSTRYKNTHKYKENKDYSRSENHKKNEDWRYKNHDDFRKVATRKSTESNRSGSEVSVGSRTRYTRRDFRRDKDSDYARAQDSRKQRDNQEPMKAEPTTKYSHRRKDDYDRSRSQYTQKRSEHLESRRDEDSDNLRSKYTYRKSRRDEDSDKLRSEYKQKRSEHLESRRDEDSDNLRSKYSYRRSRRDEDSDKSRSEYTQKHREPLRSQSRRNEDSGYSKIKYSYRKSRSDEDSDNSQTEYSQNSRVHLSSKPNKNSKSEYSYRGSKRDDDSFTSRSESSYRRSRKDDDSNTSKNQYNYRKSRKDGNSDYSKSNYTQKSRERRRSKTDESEDSKTEYSYDYRKRHYDRRLKEQPSNSWINKNRGSYLRTKFKSVWGPREMHNEMIEIPRKPKLEPKDQLPPSNQQNDTEQHSISEPQRDEDSESSKNKYNKQKTKKTTDNMSQETSGKKKSGRPKGTKNKNQKENKTRNTLEITKDEGSLQNRGPESGIFPKLNIMPRSYWKALPPTSPQPFHTQPQNVQFTFNGSSCTNPAMCIKTLQTIQNDHMKRGLSDIAYNFMIGLDSNVYEGRGWNTQPDIIEEENIEGEEPLSDSNVIISFLGEPIQFYKHMKAVNKGHELVCYGYENRLLYVPKEYHSSVFPTEIEGAEKNT